MEKKFNVLLALLAALALVFAVGCSDGSDDPVYEDGGSSNGEQSGGGDTSGDSASGGGTDSTEGTVYDACGREFTADPSTDKVGYVIESGGNWSIYTAAGLMAWAESDSVLATSATLYNCIDLSQLDGFTWTPVGSGYSNRYTGTFDGDGHTISGLSLSIDAGGYYHGFFGYIGSGGEVKNLTLYKPSVSVSGSRAYAGVIAGYNPSGGTVTGNTNTGSPSEDIGYDAA